MEPFRVSKALHAIDEIYPTATTIRHIALEGGESARFALARLWMSEGIPFAFRVRPALYESIRAWLGTRLRVDPKEITIIGSARLGESLDPTKLGTAFSPDSDLDLAIVSLDLFERLRSNFNRWSHDYESGKIAPRNDREKGFWIDNLHRGPKVLQRGFIDTWLIPNWDAYLEIQLISQTMYLLSEKLRATDRAPIIAQASVRSYRDWNSFARQLALNLT